MTPVGPLTVDLRSSRGTVSWRPSAAREPGSAPPRVVLADRAACGEFGVLQGVLERLGVPSVRIDVERVTRLELSALLGDSTITVDGRRITPTVVWARHVSARAVPGVTGSAAGLLGADSWCASILQLSALAPASLPGNGPGRLEQLAGAVRAGIRIPRTVVTTDPGAAALELSATRLVIKVVDEHFVETAPGLLVGVFPEIVEREELAGRRPAGFPVVVQEHIEHDEELRVYYLAGAVHAFMVDKKSPDAIWRAGSDVSVRSVAAPRAAVEAVRKLAGLWRLTYGAFDLLVTGGEVVFLEVNVDGDWRWFESKAGGTVVSTAAALMIRELHLRVLGRAPPPPLGVLDLLSLGGGPG